MTASGDTAVGKPRSRFGNLLRGQLRNIAPLITLLLLVIFFSAAAPSFRSLANVQNILNQVSVTGIIAVGVIGSRGGSDASTGVVADAAVPTGTFTSGDNAWGIPVNTTADVPVLSIWEDFGCPACATFEARLGTDIQKLAADGTVPVGAEAGTRTGSATRPSGAKVPRHAARSPAGSAAGERNEAARAERSSSAGTGRARGWLMPWAPGLEGAR